MNSIEKKLSCSHVSITNSSASQSITPLKHLCTAHPKSQLRTTMRESVKSKGSVKLKAILMGTSLAILVLLVIRSNYNPSSSTTREARSDKECSKKCNKIPASLAHAILHYTTSNTTPQQTFNEISVSAKVLEQKSPCNFLIFGLGHDSLMWAALNYGGRTVFLDEDETWMKQMSRRFPMLESYKVTYNTKVSQAKDLMELAVANPACRQVIDPRRSACQLVLKGLPSEVYETKWDLIMVDAPTGFHDEAPGRMTAIYTAGLMARNRGDGGETDVFVHDVDRGVEDQFSKTFLCEGYLRKQQGRIRQFTIPSHKRDDGLEKPFCPN